MTFRKPILVLVTAYTLAGQPPPPPPPRGLPPAESPQSVRQRLADAKASGETTRSILALAKVYLEQSERAGRGTPFARTRYLVTSDALLRSVEHQQHLERDKGQKEKGPLPEKAEIRRHVERVYFRLQQADYFVQQSADANARTIAGLARQYYQEALRGVDGGDLRSADECVKSCEELMRALENLALSTVPPPPPHPAPEKP